MDLWSQLKMRRIHSLFPLKFASSTLRYGFRLCTLVLLALPLSWIPAPARADVTSAANSTSACPATLVPAYFNNDALWQSVSTANPNSWVIVNPSNGVGAAIDPSYKAWIATAQARGQTVLGYIPTRYGTRSLSWVERQALKYQQRYGVTAFFLDEVSTAHRSVGYYSRLTNDLRSIFGNELVVLNPGSVPDQSYFGLGSNTDVVIFEGVAENFNAGQFPSWLQPYYSRSGIIVYKSSLTQFLSMLRFAKSKGIAAVYGTDAGASGNPYDALPSYWTSEYLAVTCN